MCQSWFCWAFCVSWYACMALSFTHIIDKEIQSAAAEARELPIYSVETQEPRIALTFDIATGTEDLAQILNVSGAASGQGYVLFFWGVGSDTGRRK